MACGSCSKRRQATGYGSVNPPAARQQAAPATAQPRPAVLRSADGSTQQFDSMLEARAARIRNGGGKVEPLR